MGGLEPIGSSAIMLLQIINARSRTAFHFRVSGGQPFSPGVPLSPELTPQWRDLGNQPNR
jgi:hypothetical protein